jgi:hypothetical protein
MTWIIIALACFSLLAALGLRQSVILRANRHVWGRPELTEDDFAARYFPEDQRAIAVTIRQLLAPYVPVNAGRIEPSDRLVEDLGLAARLSRGLDGVAFAQDIEQEFNIEFDQTDYYEMKTFRDMVNLVASKARNKPGPGPSDMS